MNDLTPSEHDGPAQSFKHEQPSRPAGKAVSTGDPLVDLLVDRLENYNTVRQEAVDQKEANKVRRYDRAIKVYVE